MSERRADNDERYVIGVCDRVLGRTAKRQHRFDFLLGDPGKSGRRVRLPVDAYYSELKLVIEYREIQHFQETYVDRRFTCSGMSRGDQRKVYDQRRRTDLPKHGIQLVELEFVRRSEWVCDGPTPQ